jgi:hypothetical protein
MHNITWSSTVLVKSWLPFDEFINFYNTGQPLSYSNLELLVNVLSALTRHTFRV